MIAAPIRYAEVKRMIQRLIHRVKRWRNAIAVGWRQEGDTGYVCIQRYGLFKQYSGVPFVCKIDIDPALTTQSSKRYENVDCSYGKSTLRRRIRLLTNDIQFWRERTVVVVGWHRDGNAVHIKAKQCGLFKKYKGNLITFDIDIATGLINLSPQ